MTDLHFEPFVHLAGLTSTAALIAWGGFWFRKRGGPGSDWEIVPDPQLGEVAAADREQSIGASSRPYGRAVVVVRDAASGAVAARAETDTTNHVWVHGLEPDTEYRYAITVDGKPWADGPRRDWIDHDSPRGRDLLGTDREYDLRFTTHPARDHPAAARFAVLGDYGIGILAAGGQGENQRRLALALERAVEHAGVRFVVTTGDNIYLGDEDTVAGTGNHDDDWYFSFYQPYRYVISRVPVYPVVGNHDTDDTEQSDDRDQLADNLFTDLRFTGDGEALRASFDPGLFYRFRYGGDIEFVAIDTTRSGELEYEYFLDSPRHRDFLDETFPPPAEEDAPPRWRIPFSHHPPYCAGPHHHNHPHLIEALVPRIEQSHVRVMFSGHEHNFQLSHVNGVDYFVTGAAGKVRTEPPDRPAEARTRGWASAGHLLIVDIDGDTMTVHPVTDVDRDGRFTYLDVQTPSGTSAECPIKIRR